MKSLLPIAAMLLGTVAALPASAARYERQPGLAVDHYVFKLEVADNTHRITGETVTTVRFLGDGLTSLFFDLQAPKPDGTGMTVSAVSEDGAAGAPLRFSQEGERLTIQLARPSRSGETRVLRIRYAGEPAEGLRFGTSRSGQRGIYSWNWPALMRNWAPVIDHISSKVTSDYVVTAPEALYRRRQRPARQRGRAGRWPQGDALAAGGADRAMAERDRHRAHAGL